MRALIVALLLSSTFAVYAEQFERHGDYVVHYAAFRSDELTAETARAAGIVRSKESGVVMLNVQYAPQGSSGKAVGAKISGRARNLFGRQEALVVREFREAGEIYSLAAFPVEHKVLTVFDLEIQPEGGAKSMLQFRHTFYTD